MARTKKSRVSFEKKIFELIVVDQSNPKLSSMDYCEIELVFSLASTFFRKSNIRCQR